MEEKKKSVFDTLNAINVQEHVEVKNIGGVKLSYLSWAWAWTEVKKAYPEAFYTIYENKDGLFYHTDGKTAWVKTGVTIEGIEHIEYLPVMDNRNHSITLDKLTSFDVNKAIQRSLTKACARHGLGLYIYAGEDLPEEEAKQAKSDMEQKIAKAVAAMRAVKSREELEQVWRTWSNQIPCADGTEFNKATREMAQQFPNPQ
ncbi:Sak single strand annealing protein [Sodaliphilus pleomorphus]|uniref:DUF1071 domain-containing protein n=1 Tax=Sodaliphilus pleomorphus TaxID=2606626 RepID=A0A6L5X7K6_9BACT|nr:DUF1071 domain-containing protein [Sodaliphilus pleomorphus]MSS16240.1 DUF1071 domain-containing protein [Sodaliphilus pleomorphus]